MAPLVSVIMPVYNSEKFVAEAIDSVLGQTFTDFEFLIVDDGSTDGSGKIIQDCADRDPRIRFFQHPENRGESAARNTAMEPAAGKYVTGMDSDDVSLPQRLEMQVAFLEAHPDIGAVGVSHQVCKEDLTPIVSQQLPSCHYAIILHFLLYTRTAMKPANVMARREYFDASPLYDLDIVVSADVDLYLRLLRESGIRFANLTEQLYLYRRHDNTMGSRYHGMRRKLYIPPRRRALGYLGARGLGALWIIERHPLTKLGWGERRRARRDITRLIEALAEHNWVDACDEPLLYAEMEKLVESTAPRYWQMFLHWYRHRIARRVQP